MVERERFQLVISLGEGQDGQRSREILDRAAAAAGKPVSTWARDTLLIAAGEGPSDPIAEVLINKNERTFVDLSAIPAMQSGWTNKVQALLAGKWTDLGTQDPDELMARWKRVKRAGH
jgi:hypothetical protein